MTDHSDLSTLATAYHKTLPRRIREYLNARGIPHPIIDRHLLGWNGWRITVPIFNRAGELVFFKLAKEPEDQTDSPKMLAAPGSAAELYGWEAVLSRPDRIIICEGEFDRLVLEAHGFPAVTSTGGAGTFHPEWVEEFARIPKVYICFDRDEAGRAGALRVGRLIPQAKIVELPEEVGEGGDVTDFFVRLGATREDFDALLETASPAPPVQGPTPPTDQASPPVTISHSNERVERLKREVPIADVIGQYVPLHPSGKNLVGHCPFHEDHRPSFTVFPVTGTFHCFGCRKHGDVITFVREIERLGFADTLDVLDRFKSSHESGHQDHR
jgi:DNA primase